MKINDFSHSRAPNRANTSAGLPPKTQSPAGVTLLRDP